jgi:hypothetical protein
MIGKLIDSLKGYESITVAKPYCIPARQQITGIFKEYGVKSYGIKEHIEYKNKIPALHVATVKVSSKQAVWAEYLLLRSKKFLLWSTPKNRKNLEWARKHKAMPQSWNGKPLREKGCK